MRKVVERSAVYAAFSIGSLVSFVMAASAALVVQVARAEPAPKADNEPSSTEADLGDFYKEFNRRGAEEAAPQLPPLFAGPQVGRTGLAEFPREELDANKALSVAELKALPTKVWEGSFSNARTSFKIAVPNIYRPAALHDVRWKIIAWRKDGCERTPANQEHKIIYCEYILSTGSAGQPYIKIHASKYSNSTRTDATVEEKCSSDKSDCIKVARSGGKFIETVEFTRTIEAKEQVKVLCEIGADVTSKRERLEMVGWMNDVCGSLKVSELK